MRDGGGHRRGSRGSVEGWRRRAAGSQQTKKTSSGDPTVKRGRRPAPALPGITSGSRVVTSYQPSGIIDSDVKYLEKDIMIH